MYEILYVLALTSFVMTIFKISTLLKLQKAHPSTIKISHNSGGLMNIF